MEWEELQRLANRRLEREQGRRDVTEDMSEDLSEGEKGDGVGEIQTPDTPRKKFQRNFSNLEVWSDDKKEKKLYIVLIRYDSVQYMIVVLRTCFLMVFKPSNCLINLLNL